MGRYREVDQTSSIHKVPTGQTSLSLQEQEQEQENGFRGRKEGSASYCCPPL